MPGLRSPPAARTDRQLLRWRRRRGGLAPRADETPLRGAGRGRPRVVRTCEDWPTPRQTAELGRLLYVGCTRAKERLHLRAALEQRGGGGTPSRWKQPAPRNRTGGALAGAFRIGAGPRRRGGREPMSDARKLTGSRSGVCPRGWRLRRFRSRFRERTGPGGAQRQTATPWSSTGRERPPAGSERSRIASFGESPERGGNAWNAQGIASERKRIARRAFGPSAFDGRRSRRSRRAGRGRRSPRTVADPRGRWLFDAATPRPA